MPRSCLAMLDRVYCCAMSTGFALRNKVQSLDRALEILKLLGSEPEMRVTDLARRLEVHKSTAFRLLSTLQEHGLVEQNPSTERYRLRRGRGPPPAAGGGGRGAR